ncbi:MAG: hybrid sensor histidine kinase/response regulator [Elusimicrobiota bacterium]
MTPSTIPIYRGIVIEDDPVQVLFLKELFHAPSVPRFEMEFFDRLSDGLARVDEGGIDVILLDLSLPDSRGLETFARALAQAPATAVIVLAELGSESLAIQAIQEGAQDYLVKGHLDREMLLRSLRYAVERQRIIHRKEQSLQNLSHELRNPLAAIYGSVRALHDAATAGEIPAPLHRLVEIASRSTDHLWSMIDDLLDVVRVETGKLAVEPEYLPLSELIVQTLDGFAAAAAAKGIALSADVPPGLPPVLADPVRIRQVLINLISNGLKFTPAHGKIQVGASVLPGGGGLLRIAVTDTGRGIAVANAERLFQRLYQTAPGDEDRHTGLGLGLFICKELVTRQGGRIWAESVPGQGSTFYFTLPVFSLERNLRQVFGDGLLRTRSLALIEVDVLSGGAHLRPLDREHVLQEARSLLKPAGPSVDLILPRPEADWAAYPLLLVMRADREQAHIVAERIRIKMLSSTVMKDNDLKPTVSFTCVDLPEPAGTLTDRVGHAAARIGEITESVIRKYRSGGSASAPESAA